MGLLLLCAVLFLDEPYVHENPAFELQLPSDEWTLHDQTTGSITVLVFSPGSMATRCSVLRFPKSMMPQGLHTRADQIDAAAGDAYVEVSMEPGRISERDAMRWEYTLSGGTTIEWGFLDGDNFVVFQVAAPPVVWGDEARHAEMDALVESFVWIGGDEPVDLSVDVTSPADVRKMRAAAAITERPFEVVHHTIEATIEPDEHSIDVQDTVQIVSNQDDLNEIRLYTTIVVVDDVTANVPVSWSTEALDNADLLLIELEHPLSKGEALELVVHAASDDFIQRVDQNLVAEISVVGQVRPRSSWSSHVVWYPMDEGNDAAVDITLDVPDTMMAFTGGQLVEQSEANGRRRFRYVREQRVAHQIPFGFAVGDYVTKECTSEAGLHMTVAGYPGEEKLIQQRVDVLLEAAAAFERALGPLPWSEVRFVHVTPDDKETGVSLPGMILVSDGYFPDLEGVDASDGNLSSPTVLGLLVVADELSHQWNFYAAGFPNELAEGISTYTNCLFVEVRHDVEAYARTIEYCRSAWIGGAGPMTEFAIANPAVYSNARYRAVVFCKTPVVLDALRRHLGDEVFFDGFRRAFANEDPSVDGFDRMQKGFEDASREDLQWFFDQWFFRAGFPILETEFEATDVGAKIMVRQTHDGEPYRMMAQLEVTCEDGTVLYFPVQLDRAVQMFPYRLPSPPKSVQIGPKGRLPALVR